MAREVNLLAELPHAIHGRPAPLAVAPAASAAAIFAL